MTEPKTSPPGRTSDLPEQIKKRLDALDGRLGTIDHYTLLGLLRSATRAQIRSSLLSAAPDFHPDRYFGKKIDPAYAAKMQRVFARMALAHDTLIDDARRAEYDRALPPPLPPAAPTSPAPAAERVDSSPPATSPPATSPSTGSPPAAAPLPPMRPPSASSPEFERSRAQAFATRLAGSNRLRAPTPVQAFRPGIPPQSGIQPQVRGSETAVDAKAAVDALRRRYEESVARAHTKQSSSHVHAAEQAALRGDHAEAARLYRVALDHSSDPTIKATLVQAEIRAREQSLMAAVGKAKELEQKQEFAQAAICWARAFEITPTGETANRAALCFRRAGTDLRKATKYGEEAVKLDPSKIAYRVTLALAYADAGLLLRARGEIERAQALEPKSPVVKEAAQKIKSMG